MTEKVPKEITTGSGCEMEYGKKNSDNDKVMMIKRSKVIMAVSITTMTI